MSNEGPKPPGTFTYVGFDGKPVSIQQADSAPIPEGKFIYINQKGERVVVGNKTDTKPELQNRPS